MDGKSHTSLVHWQCTLALTHRYSNTAACCCAAAPRISVTCWLQCRPCSLRKAPCSCTLSKAKDCTPTTCVTHLYGGLRTLQLQSATSNKANLGLAKQACTCCVHALVARF